MTDEQIKQKAEKYAEEHMVRTDSGGWEEDYDYEEQKNAYIAGAHSRDDEIERIKNEATAIMDEACALKTELNRLRNPWISVEDRLPEEDPNDKGYSVGVIGFFPDGRISECFCSIEEDIWFIEGITCDKPTHWMPIPELQTTK